LSSAFSSIHADHSSIHFGHADACAIPSNRSHWNLLLATASPEPIPRLMQGCSAARAFRRALPLAPSADSN
jgi:hypothetical protein